VANIPFEGGDFSFSAMTAGKREAEILACKEGEGLFVIERSTWNKNHVITSVRLTFAPGYQDAYADLIVPNRYLPFQTGSRFSANALKPSRLSSEP
jgi:hypothetical protein